MSRLLSILTFEVSSKFFGVILGGILFSFFLLVISLNLWVDPFFIFRQSSLEPRLASIDEHQRFAKSLQVITRQPHTVLLGSSRVYRGFDVEGGFYNMGISSLTLPEAASYVNHITRFTHVRRIILGLDFWMCDSTTPTQAGWDKKTGTFSYMVKSFLEALFRPKESFTTLKAWRSKKKQASEEEGWTYGGFFRTGKRSKHEVQAMLDSYENHFQKTNIQIEMLSQLEEIIYQCQKKGVKLYVYISPLHPATKAIYKKSTNAPYFEPWRKKIFTICTNNKIPFQDFSDFLNDSVPLSNGSNSIWLDYSHFRPSVGQIILQKLGVT